MTTIAPKITRWYSRTILDHPVVVIVCLALIIAVWGYHAKDFRIDASADALFLENDKDLRYARQVSERYGVHDFLLISYTPRTGDLLAQDNLNALGRLQNELSELDGVASVLTILDVPLLESPPVSYEDISNHIPTLQTPAIDKALARIELKESPFYRDLLVSPDLQTTALVVNLESDPVYTDLIATRNDYLDQQAQNRLSAQDASKLNAVNDQIRRYQIQMNALQHQNIAAIRAIMDRYRPQAQLFLGGISMIADDMITFIKNDLKTFGAGVFLLLVFMLDVIHPDFVATDFICHGVEMRGIRLR